MRYYTKGLYRRLFLILSGAELLLFVIFYLNGFIFDFGDFSVPVEYVRYFLDDLVHFTAVCVIAKVALMGREFYGFKHAALYTLPLVLSRLFYTVPYYYLYHVYSGFDSVEGILASLLISTLILTVTYLWCILMMTVGHLYLKRSCAKEEISTISALGETDIFDFGLPSAAATVAMVFLGFGAELIEEIVNTVSYLIEYADSYRISEIFYIVFCFVFLALKLVVAHTVLVLTRKMIIKKRTATASDK